MDKLNIGISFGCYYIMYKWIKFVFVLDFVVLRFFFLGFLGYIFLLYIFFGMMFFLYVRVVFNKRWCKMCFLLNKVFFKKMK